MELKKFFKLLRTYRRVLIFVPLVTAVLTFLLARKLPKEYLSASRISTNFVDRSDALVHKENDNNGDGINKINQEFSNLIELMKIRQVINQVSYQLMIHDLTTNQPFRKPSSKLKQLNNSARKHALAVYQDKYAKQEELSLFNSDEKGIHTVLVSMGYDYESLLKNFTFFRVGESDFIDMTFTSEDPQLSAFAVNTLTQEFINYYSSINRQNQDKALNFLDSLLHEKESILNRKKDSLKNYKIQNGVLMLKDKSTNLYGQLTDLQTKEQTALKDYGAYNLAIKQIDNKFNPKDRKYFESALTNINGTILTTREQLHAANEQYIKSGFNSAYKKRIDSLQNVLSGLINQTTEKYATNPMATKENLVSQKMNMEVSRDLAQSTISTARNEINRLNGQLKSLVPNEAIIQSFESDIDVYTKSYLEIFQKYNDAKTAARYTVNLRQIETGMPNDAKSSKTAVMTILGGLVSFIFCLLVLFLIYYFNKAVESAEELANKTETPVIGELSKIDNTKFDAIKLWDQKDISLENKKLRTDLRSIRYEIDKLVTPNTIMGVLSLQSKDGKTFLSINLGNAYAAINKKVLVIDGNFTNPEITKVLSPKYYIEDVLGNSADFVDQSKESNIHILGNRGYSNSLLELFPQKQIEDQILKLKNHFDVIILEIPALNELENSKEWLLFTDYLVGVFSKNGKIKHDLKPALNEMKADPKFIGWIFNNNILSEIKYKKEVKRDI